MLRMRGSEQQASGLRGWSWRAGTVSGLTGATTALARLRILVLPAVGGDAFWPGRRVPSLDLAPVLARPGENLNQGLGPLASERISGSPPVNRTSVIPSRRTATEISRDTSSSVSRARPGSQSRPSVGMQ
jgi:hypothetical protein